MSAPDFTITSHGSVATLEAVSDEGQAEFDEKIAPDLEGWQSAGRYGFSSDWRAIEACVDQLRQNGFLVLRA